MVMFYIITTTTRQMKIIITTKYCQQHLYVRYDGKQRRLSYDQIYSLHWIFDEVKRHCKQIKKQGFNFNTHSFKSIDFIEDNTNSPLIKTKKMNVTKLIS